MAVCAPQVHLEPKMTIQDPMLWLAQLSVHSVSITFAPNFFLAAVVKAIGNPGDHTSWNLSKLRVVVSGGEANSVHTGLAFIEMARKLGATTDVLCPAFGMTESCAGSVYNLDFPALELDAGLDFCSVGQSIHTMNVRVVDAEGKVVPLGQMGNFEIGGPAVFQAYHNGATHTMEYFGSDGWFRTGDTGYLDPKGNLILAGRSKDSIIINGVKYFSHELETAVEDAAVPYVTPSYTSAFPTRPPSSDSEEVIITFLPSEHLDNEASLIAALESISRATFLYCSKKPRSIIPLPRKFLRKSSLGKLSRSALKKEYEAGKFNAFIEDVVGRVSNYRKSTRSSPKSVLERQVAEIFATEFDLDLKEISVSDSLTDFGVDSIRLLRLKGVLQQRLGRQEEIPVGVLLTNPSIRGLAGALSQDNHAASYNPVVELQLRQSQDTPIWFIHPGLGEILVFLNISRYLSDRQVYAIRAPGFNPGEEMFSSIDEMTE
jgi:acyl carrier protein